jgi:hypothetical protein
MLLCHSVLGSALLALLGMQSGSCWQTRPEEGAELGDAMTGVPLCAG